MKDTLSRDEQRELERLAREHPFCLPEIKEAYDIVGDVDLVKQACIHATLYGRGSYLASLARDLRDIRDTNRL